MIIQSVIRYTNAPAIEVNWVDENGIVGRCQVYDATQMNALREDLGEAAEEYEPLIRQCVADYVPPVPESPAEVALQAIFALEVSSQMASQRLYREAVIGMVEKEAKAIGLTIAQLKAKNKGYAGLKALDEQIAALRTQL